MVMTVVVAALLLPVGAARAHDGHSRSVMGVVSERHDMDLLVKTKEGKILTILLTDKTEVVRGTKKLTLDAIAIGDRVVVDVGSGRAPLVARGVKLGAVAAPPPGS